MGEPVTILWFKRDLRIADHPALASVSGPVVPLYIAEPKAWAQPDASARQWAFVAEALAELRADLAARGAPLVIRVGEPVAVFEALRQVRPIARLVSHQETGLRWSWDRDRRVAAWARAHRIAWDEPVDSGVIRRLDTRDRWAGRRDAFLRAPLAELPAVLEGPEVAPGPVPDAAALGLAADPCPGRQPGGRRAGLALLDSFLDHRAETYRAAMSSPVTAEDACSRLSAHLAWGTLSVRETHRAAAARLADSPHKAALRAFISRLAWRDHFTQKLEDFPDLDRRCMHPAFDGIRDTDPSLLEAWAEGRTGLPFVDACMRYARATGWLNFRMRAMVQAVASYHLWLDWRDSAPVLARLWTDYAPGIHFAQAQMQSGVTGINQLRIYNPIKQGRDQDPTGVFTRRWVPELAALPVDLVQEPWRAASPPRDYPAPIVDVAETARAARARIGAARQSPDFQHVAAQIVARHGSRKGPSDRRPRAAKRRGDARQGELNL